jgi:hypothetical protein
VRRSLDQADGARRALWLAGPHDRRQEAMIGRASRPSLGRTSGRLGAAHRGRCRVVPVAIGTDRAQSRPQSLSGREDADRGEARGRRRAMSKFTGIVGLPATRPESAEHGGLSLSPSPRLSGVRHVRLPRAAVRALIALLRHGRSPRRPPMRRAGRRAGSTMSPIPRPAASRTRPAAM